METATQKSKLEIIQETVDYYSEDVSRRGVNASGGCYYYTEDGKMCAFGRCCINPEEVEKLSRERGEEDYTNGTSVNCFGVQMNDLLKPEYRGHTSQFWRDLQTLHDNQDNWDNRGITELGLDTVQNLKERYK